MTNDQPIVTNDHVRLMLDAIKRETGHFPFVICHSEYWGMLPDDRIGKSFLVLQDDTFERWNQPSISEVLQEMREDRL